MTTRRDFLEGLAAATGSVVLLPTAISCKSGADETSRPAPSPASKTGSTEPGEPTATKKPDTAPTPTAATPSVPPAERPSDFDAIAYNRERGNAGAIPESYRDDINGPDGANKHLGKHLPFQPTWSEGGKPLSAAEVAKKIPAGFIALMWGDPSRGYARHPNAKRGPDNGGEGHWYNWIKIRKAVAGDAVEAESQYPEWPGGSDEEQARYVVQGGGGIEDDGGRNTVYLAKLPDDVKAGDTVRIWAHCLTHGEFVDFITIA